MKTVLLVDDDAAVCDVLTEALELAGFQVLSTDNAEDALITAYQTPDIGLLVTDIVMPSMNGAQLGDRFSRMRPDAKVIYMSGYMQGVSAMPGADTQPTLLEKPFTPATLVARVHEAFNENITGEL